MQKINKGVVAIAVVIVVTGFVFYQYAAKVFQSTQKNNEGVPRAEKPAVKEEVKTEPMLPVGAKEVSALVSYDVPEADIVHNVKFSVVLNSEGKVLEVRMVEMPKAVASEKQAEFAAGLTTQIKGKQLSEITKVDKVGKSTITTDAFNSIVGDLKAKL